MALYVKFPLKNFDLRQKMYCFTVAYRLNTAPTLKSLLSFSSKGYYSQIKNQTVAYPS